MILRNQMVSEVLYVRQSEYKSDNVIFKCQCLKSGNCIFRAAWKAFDAGHQRGGKRKFGGGGRGGGSFHKKRRGGGGGGQWNRGKKGYSGKNRGGD